jgi:GTP-binding protein HflX
LPERLLASFESTLSEVSEATLLVIVLDASDHERALHLQTAHDVLSRLGAEQIPRFYVWNKLDRATDVDSSELAALSDGHPFRALSTRDDAAISELSSTLITTAREGEEPVTMVVPYDASDILGLVYARCRVTDSEALPEGLRLTFQGPAQATAQIRARMERRSR